MEIDMPDLLPTSRNKERAKSALHSFTNGSKPFSSVQTSALIKDEVHKDQTEHLAAGRITSQNKRNRNTA